MSMKVPIFKHSQRQKRRLTSHMVHSVLESAINHSIDKSRLVVHEAIYDDMNISVHKTHIKYT